MIAREKADQWMLEYHEVLLIRDFAKISARKNGHMLADRLDNIVKTMRYGATCHVVVVEKGEEK